MTRQEMLDRLGVCEDKDPAHDMSDAELLEHLKSFDLLDTSDVPIYIETQGPGNE